MSTRTKNALLKSISIPYFIACGNEKIDLIEQTAIQSKIIIFYLTGFTPHQFFTFILYYTIY